MNLFIIIVNYKKYQETKICLSSIFKYVPKIFTENISLIDNESNEESEGVEGIKKQFPKVLIIKSKINLGFARGVNLGVGEALKRKATHILILNNDTIVNSDFITPLVNSKFDLVSPILKFKRKGEWVYDLGGKVNWLIGRPYHINIKYKILNIKYKNKLPIIDYVSGCAMLIRKEVFEKIGVFDEKFFLYFEDVDFCLRAKKAGFKIGTADNTVLTHFLEEKKSETRLFKLKSLVNSQRYFIKKWIPYCFRPLALFYYWWMKQKMNG